MISDGGDNASRTGYAQLREHLRRSRATVYTVGIHDLAQRERSPAFLERLASDSGGLSFFPAVLAQLDDTARRIATDMRRRYVLGFRAPAVQERQERKLRVRISAPGSGGWKVRTRRGYVALPERPSPSKSP
ncbi:MAG: hypothetical protein R2762_28355 [Bryobacteraceae bacterium]